MSAFAYEAQTHQGEPVTGTVDAAELSIAEQKLAAMGLRVSSIKPADAPKPKRSLGAADFLAFNQQLAQLTAAGLPVERGLRLIGADLRRGRLKLTIDSLATELEKGQSLEEAFAAHRNQFPPLYSQVVEAGIRGGNLPAVLLALGRHLDTTRNLRTELVRTIAYPMMILLAIGILMVFLSQAVFPQLISTYADIIGATGPKWRAFNPKTWNVVEFEFDVNLPLVTRVVYAASLYLGPAIALAALVCLVMPLLWGMAPGSGLSRLMDAVLWRVPLVGPVIRRSLVARWLDALSIALTAGLDLPNAMSMANNAVASPRVARDVRAIIAALEAGRPLDTVSGLAVIPQSLPSILQIAATAGNLPEAAALLADSHRQQAETRIGIIPTVLTPILMTLVALVVAGLLLAMLAPLGKMLNWMGGMF